MVIFCKYFLLFSKIKSLLTKCYSDPYYIIKSEIKNKDLVSF
uniref:Uncharacterized protein n=1 Tax=Myoviridae sp. ctn8H20 TaxID=2825169 RepID=A0A8S5QFJ9_9CAUD|nr:MAG TPA: hypothetical protein [Myoviridae sp. ctn8H20]